MFVTCVLMSVLTGRHAHLMFPEKKKKSPFLCSSFCHIVKEYENHDKDLKIGGTVHLLASNKCIKKIMSVRRFQVLFSIPGSKMYMYVCACVVCLREKKAFQ